MKRMLKYTKNNYYLTALQFLFLLPINSQAQPYSFTNLSVKDGLSQSTVNTIFQDRNGFMWFGTGDGLNRFDGHNFQIFKHNEQDSNSLINNSIRRILEDKNGNLWIGTDAGVSLYNTKNKNFHHFSGKINENIFLLCIENNKIWFWKYRFGIGFIDIDSKKSTLFLLTNISKTLIVNECIYNKKTNEIIIASTNGLFCYNTKINEISEINGAENSLCFSLKLTRNNLLIVGTNKEIIVFEVYGKSKNLISKIKNKYTKNVIAIEEDLLGKIWIGTYGNGLFLLQKQNSTIVQIKNSEKRKNSNLIKSIYKDFSNNIWIGTDGDGIKNWSNYKLKFKHISVESNLEPIQLSADFIKCFAETNDHKILVASLDKGLNIFNPKNESNELTYKFGKSIQKINRDSDKNFWIIADQTIKKYNEKLSNPHQIKLPKKPYLYYPNCVFTDSKKNTWIGCTTGLYKVDSLLNTTFINHSDSFSFYTIFEDSEHTIWFSTNNDMMCINDDYTKLLNVKEFEKTFIRNILEYEKTLWFSGKNGLHSYSLKTKKKSRFGINNGLPDLMIYGVIPVNNCLWISSNNGLSKFEISNKIFRNYNLNDGLQSNEFNTNAFFKATNGWLYFGGINGFNYFDPTQVLDNPNKPKTVITNIKLFDIDLPLNKEVSQLHDLILRHDQNILSFEFSSLEFTDVSRNKYAYKMEGIDTGWVNSGIRNFVRYANLEPGDYEFKVKSYNNDGIGNEIPAKIRIFILTPWWKSWWFKTMMVVTMVIIVYLSFKVILYRKLLVQKQINQRLIAVENERSRISKDMHDDMGSGLSKIAIMSQLLKTKLVNKTEADQVEKISQTAKDLVDSMGQIVWSMNPENNQLESLVSYIREYSIDFFEDSNIKCKIDFPDEINEIKLSQQKRRNVFLVIKETLNNTLKYSLASEVKISLLVDKSKLTITIVDNGKGFDLTQTRRFGNGLINMKKRMDEIAGNYIINSTLNGGTTTVITI